MENVLQEKIAIYASHLKDEIFIKHERKVLALGYALVPLAVFGVVDVVCFADVTWITHYHCSYIVI